MIVLSRMIEALIMPPGGMLVLLLLGLMIRVRWSRAGNAIMVLAMLFLYVSSTPAFVRPISEFSSSQFPALNPDVVDSGAIVVLGSGRRDYADEYGQLDTVSNYGLERLRYAAWLHRRTGLPILATGGRVFGERESEAELMKRYLEEQGVALTFVEDQSRNTFENAEFSKRMLNEAGINRVILVTHGLHMPRSVWSFERAGFEVIAAPTVIHSGKARGGALDFLPSAGDLYVFNRVAHEWLGRLWYRLKY